MTTAGIQTKYGKAFEYACVISLCEGLKGHQEVTIEESPQLSSARSDFQSVDDEMKNALVKAADAAVRVIRRLEPQLWEPNGNEPLNLSIQPDAAGIRGDVRDVLCIRKQNGWEIGLSCKHNHHAVKHSRLSATIDFGKEWLDEPCSDVYFGKVVPLFNELKEYRDNSKVAGKPMLWEELDDTLEAFPPSVEIRFEKVRGHSGDFWNEEVDKMAVAAYAAPETNPETDTGYERISPAKNGHRHEGIRREDDPVVTEVTLKGIDKPGDREALVTLSNGTVIKVTGYQGGFIQSGGVHKEFMATVDIASRLAKWLNGGEL